MPSSSERTSESPGTGWSGPGGSIGVYIREQHEKTLESYRVQPILILEHANGEQDSIRGGYARRQLFELVQNSADALSGTSGGTIHIRLTRENLYCADDGNPISPDGVRALMFSRLSPKRGTAEIGRFGVGFKSVLGVTDSPEFFSRSGSFRFDRVGSEKLLQGLSPGANRYPVLRLPAAMDPQRESDTDPILSDLMGWAVNVVRLPLIPGGYRTLEQQIRDFPQEFLLFVEHVSKLELRTDKQRDDRSVNLRRENGRFVLDNGVSTSLWMLTKITHSLTLDAKGDSRSLDDAEEVPIWWAAPLGRLNEPGRFWAFFPTLTASLVAGILNAPWKTNEDRQNLLSGVYNDELIRAAAAMIADALPRLATRDDPCKHLDALPRRKESGDSDHSELLRECLFKLLADSKVVPDQEGTLRRWQDLSYPPKELIESDQAGPAIERWEQYEHRPSSWLHHRALASTRMARLRVLTGNRHESRSIGQWLEALVKTPPSRKNPVRASMAAIQTAASIPGTIRHRKRLGDIVLTSGDGWVEPDPEAVFFGGGNVVSESNVVHPDLEADRRTREALGELGIKPISPETQFRSYASECGKWGSRRTTEQDEYWREFWRLAREVEQSAAVEIIKSLRLEWRGRNYRFQDLVHVCTVSGEWRPMFAVLLPGRIVPADGSRDSRVAVDTEIHGPDLALLKGVGVVETPRPLYELANHEMFLYKSLCRGEYIMRDHLPRNPQKDYLNFREHTTSGPLGVLKQLSQEGNALYTWEILRLEETYQSWTMRHDTQKMYPSMEFPSPAIDRIQERGLVRIGDDFKPVFYGLGEEPRDFTVQRKLLSHPKAYLIRGALDLHLLKTSVRPEPIGSDPPIPLVDMWPGLGPYLSQDHRDFDLIRCEALRVGRREEDSIVHNNTIYVTRQTEERQELLTVLQTLGTRIGDKVTVRILSHETPEDVQRARDEIRACSTDEERLLKAVGEDTLKTRLPTGLLSILEDREPAFGDTRLAQAAIATFHTDALREYRHALTHLDPPQQWAGGARAVEFVRSLGFGVEWAGESKNQRHPYVEVPGPHPLPTLHPYQRRIADNLKDLLRTNHPTDQRRGLISMPTGSGKTRVAVQAIVEAIREAGLGGGVLWVADRQELCDQAVEAWRQIWANQGTKATLLRISRMWGGQSPPLPTADMHVVVATVQTASSKLASRSKEYEFLSDFKVLVFDEAHRSITRTSTSVMRELGLMHWRRAQEPFLIGLTATPYRGYDEAETRRLVNRYGRNRLDTAGFESSDPEDVIRELQNMGVLARADHQIIEGGHFNLSPEELRQARDNPWLPRTVQDRIAKDADRTRRIIRTYQERIDPDWSTLIFATSVDHAKTVAALLTVIGIKARAVSSHTDTATRRRVVEEFRAGEIKALVNYAVFREGFDAPKTRAIIVARPVYSPNLYFQMIGRGLRGVANGGNDRCLILNVEDNIENFEGRLAFTELEGLWD